MYWNSEKSGKDDAQCVGYGDHTHRELATIGRNLKIIAIQFDILIELLHRGWL